MPHGTVRRASQVAVRSVKESSRGGLLLHRHRLPQHAADGRSVPGARAVDELLAIAVIGEGDEVEKVDFEVRRDGLQRRQRRPRKTMLEVGDVPLRTDLALIGELFKRQPSCLSKFADASTDARREWIRGRTPRHRADATNVNNKTSSSWTNSTSEKTMSFISKGEGAMRTRVFSVLIAAGLALGVSTGCGKSVAVKKDSAEEEAAAKAAVSAAEQTANEKAATAARQKAADDAKQSIDDALKDFAAASDAGIRRAKYLVLVDRLAAAKPAIDISIYKGLPVAALTPLFNRLMIIRAVEEADEKEAPLIPPKPEHEPPKYNGTFHLWGQVRKCYKDGVVLEAGEKFYFVSDAVCPDGTSLHGFVEESGRTVHIDIGRDGRDAIVVKIGDKESERDDRAAHNKAVADYEADYAKKLKEYQDATRGNATLLASLETRRIARNADREAISRSLDPVLLALAKEAAKGGDLSAVKAPLVALPPGAAVRGSTTERLPPTSPEIVPLGAVGERAPSPASSAPLGPSAKGAASSDFSDNPY
jgi:hypothetical protein